MPELAPIYDRLVTLAGSGDRAARFLSTWCPPAYLGGHSETGVGFGVTTILRYILEVGDTVDESLDILNPVPSHMAYNIVHR